MEPLTPQPEDPQISGHAAERRRLSMQWERNEAELARLRDLPAGETDPAARERQLDQDQDDIEGALGEIYLRDRGEQLESDG